VLGDRVNRYAEELEVPILALLFVPLLPDRQLIAAASPRGPAEQQQSLTGEVADVNGSTVHRRKLKVGERVTQVSDAERAHR
jgi:hypothetical protein